VQFSASSFGTYCVKSKNSLANRAVILWIIDSDRVVVTCYVCTVWDITRCYYVTICDCLFVGIVGLSRGDRDTGSPEVAGLQMDSQPSSLDTVESCSQFGVGVVWCSCNCRWDDDNVSLCSVLLLALFTIIAYSILYVSNRAAIVCSHFICVCINECQVAYNMGPRAQADMITPWMRLFDACIHVFYTN